MTQDKALILGGTGFIGRALAVELQRRGCEVHVVARHPGEPFPDAGIRLHLCSVDDFAAVHRLARSCPLIFYLASDSTPAQNAQSPAVEADVNLLPLLRCLEMLKDGGPHHLLFASSGGTVYGNPRTTPVAESHPAAAISFHGAGKIAAEAFLTAAARQFDTRITVLRPSNVYGPGQAYRPHFGLIRKILEHARLGRAVDIWGDGHNVRDYLFIDDLIDACITLADDASEQPEPRIFNIGFGRGYSVNEICDIVERVTGIELERSYKSSRRVDVREIVLDVAALGAATGWQPRVGIEAGIRKTWQWLMNDGA